MRREETSGERHLTTGADSRSSWRQDFTLGATLADDVEDVEGSEDVDGFLLRQLSNKPR